MPSVRRIRDDPEMSRESLVIAAAVLAGALVALVVARWLRGWRGSWRARTRAARAGAGEHDAAQLLRDAGFTIVARQARTWWTPLVDGEPQETELRADYLVEADGELLVAEVKTGDQAPRFETAATRRQLLEYQVAFAVAYGAHGVLLVCPERGTIHRIEFPLPAPGVRRPVDRHT
jgi:Holliday junction resolvase-like predicted endonuclease